MNSFTLDKSTIEVVDLTETDTQTEYWRSRSVQERLEALEYQRQHLFAYDPYHPTSKSS